MRKQFRTMLTENMCHNPPGDHETVKSRILAKEGWTYGQTTQNRHTKKEVTNLENYKLFTIFTNIYKYRMEIFFL